MDKKVCGNYTDSTPDTLQIIYINIEGKLIISKSLLDMIDRGIFTIYSLREYDVRDIYNVKYVVYLTNDTYIILLECGCITIISKKLESTLLNFINTHTDISQIQIINFTTLLFLSESHIIIYKTTYESTYQIEKVECAFDIKSIMFHDDYSSECIITDSLDIRRACWINMLDESKLVTIVEIPELTEFIKNSCGDEEILSMYSSFKFNVLIIYTLSNKVLSTIPYTILPYSSNYSLIVLDANICMNLLKIWNNKKISKIYYVCSELTFDYSKYIEKLTNDTLEIAKILDLNDINIEDTYDTIFDNWSIRIYILNNELIVLDLMADVKLSAFDSKYSPNLLQCGIYGTYI